MYSFPQKNFQSSYQGKILYYFHLILCFSSNIYIINWSYAMQVLNNKNSLVLII